MHEAVLKKIADIKNFYGEEPQCYMVAMILSTNFGGQVWYNNNHCVTLIEEEFYDKKGVVSIEDFEKGGYMPLHTYGIHVEQSLIDAMYESMKQKLYPCDSCGKKVPIRSKGLCPSCREQQRVNNGTSTMLSKKSHIPKITDKTRKKNKEKKKERDVYFDYHINRCKASEDSGIVIYNATRANICHLLPKSTHQSVQANLDNCIYLTFPEHERFDKLLFEHDFEALEEQFEIGWKIACERLKKVIPLSTETTNLKTALTKYLEL